MSRLPSLFISHGPPTLPLERSPAADFLRELGPQLVREHGKPSAILCASAHWETDEPALSTAESPETIHDFYGFPDALYRLRYPAPGARSVALKAAVHLARAGFVFDLSPTQGLDHGAWVPLLLMFPEADIPVAQIALQPSRGVAYHLALGEALAPLREAGVLILGSGNLTHNLRDAIGRRQSGAGADAAPPDWALSFANWMTERVVRGAFAELSGYREGAAHAVMAHPTDEHLLPLFVAAGAAGLGARGKLLHESYLFGSLNMGAYAFEVP